MIDNISDEFRKFRVCPTWLAECTLQEPTAAPGVFYHGSPDIGISEFSGQHAGGNGAVFFTHDPTYAAAFIAIHNQTKAAGGRIYRAELVINNPYIIEDRCVWKENVGLDREIEREVIEQARADGFDSIITDRSGDTIHEIIVLNDSANRMLDQNVGPLEKITFGEGYKPLIRYFADGALPPVTAPEWCTPLFASLNEAREYGDSCRAVEVNAPNPIYLDRAVWPRMNFHLLRAMNAGCLIDPMSGDVLVVGLGDVMTTMRPGNRRIRRATGAKLRRKHRIKGVRV